MLRGSYALYLRRQGDIDGAKTYGGEFIDRWWSKKTAGLIQFLSPYQEP